LKAAYSEKQKAESRKQKPEMGKENTGEQRAPMESTHPESQKAETGEQSPWAQRSPVEFTPHQDGSKTLQRSLWVVVALLGIIALQLFFASGSRPPDRWEYMDRTVIIPLIPSALTVAGQAGWEVISVSELTGFDKIDRRLWFKRRLHSGNAALDRAADPWPVPIH
jgi:hypothetical protein